MHAGHVVDLSGSKGKEIGAAFIVNNLPQQVRSPNLPHWKGKKASSKKTERESKVSF